jgi:hypothetical protein
LCPPSTGTRRCTAFKIHRVNLNFQGNFVHLN